MNRLPGWEDRLDAVLVAAANKPYRLGSHDCLRLACRAVEALTGQDYWRDFSGRYCSQKGALRRIRMYGNTLTDAVTAVLGINPMEPMMARRGDLLTYRDEKGEHLGVCAGATVALMAEGGVTFVALDDSRLLHCWRIG
jgi:hypothetical protein